MFISLLPRIQELGEDPQGELGGQPQRAHPPGKDPGVHPDRGGPPGQEDRGDRGQDQREEGLVKVILIAGPSSSGKTTFSKKLMIQLRVVGRNPVTISLDDYFKPQALTPKDEEGRHDFESLEALDVELLTTTSSGSCGVRRWRSRPSISTRGAKADRAPDEAARAGASHP